MNYLIHILLSGEDPYLSIGNFIADHLRGTLAKEKIPDAVIRGIYFHRQIDRFSDTHPSVNKAVKLIYPFFHHYSSVVVDIYFDHFLIQHWNTYCKKDIQYFVEQFYEQLKSHWDILPAKSQKIAAKIISTNWLLKPKDLTGLSEIFVSFKRRTHFPNHLEQASNVLLNNYDEMENLFLSFMPDLIYFSDLHKRYFTR